jgi:hypothetical protein
MLEQRRLSFSCSSTQCVVLIDAISILKPHGISIANIIEFVTNHGLNPGHNFQGIWQTTVRHLDTFVVSFHSVECDEHVDWQFKTVEPCEQILAWVSPSSPLVNCATLMFCLNKDDNDFIFMLFYSVCCFDQCNIKFKATGPINY